MAHRRITFPSRGTLKIELEGIYHYVDGLGPWPAAIVAHPHPLYGGTMNNNVVLAIARALAGRGVLALRFNFRGVMASMGDYDQGRGEQDDVAGALDWLQAQPEVDGRRLAVVGYSFGAWVALAEAVADARVTAAAAVGMVAWRFDGDPEEPVDGRVQFAAGYLQSLTCPKLFIAGERDVIAPPTTLRTLVDHLMPPKELHILRGADHSFQGHEQRIGEIVTDWFAHF